MRRRGERGVSFLETLVATMLLGVAILASSGILLRCQRISAAIEERARAEHAAATEVDWLLAEMEVGKVHGTFPWRSGADEGAGLPGAEGFVTVEPLDGSGLILVRVRLAWGDGKSLVRETVLRRGGGS